MIKSMTGFGRHEDTVDGRLVSAEIKSVNHKFFEFNLKISRGYSFLEDKIKKYLQSRISRGKIDLYIHIENLEEDDASVKVNHFLAMGYINGLKEIAAAYGLKGEPQISDVARFTDIFSVHKEPEDEEKIWSIVLSVLEKAVDSFLMMREIEGERLKEDILGRAEYILSVVEKIEARSPETVEEYRKKLELKLKEILADKNIEESRIITEAAIFADKVAVAEETVRLRSHIRQLNSFADSEEAIGRKMDFLIQEMNREANTIGSKASDSEIAYMVVDIKSEIEKIREQVQNIE